MNSVEHTESGGFSTLELDTKILHNLEKIGYETPTPIQAQFIPLALTGQDCIGQAQTGTGKTAAFLLPILNRTNWRHNYPQALILCPTRELAVQSTQESIRLSQGTKIRSVTLTGGHPVRKQSRELAEGCQIAIGTPGRILQHIRSGQLNLSKVHILVLDEADRMLDIGFRPDIEKILRRVPEHRQTMLLSATMPPPVRRLAGRYMKDPKSIDIEPESVAVDRIQQSYFTVDKHKKLELLLRLIERDNPVRCIIFCRRKRDVDFLVHDLEVHHPDVARMHGDLDQKKRNKIMDKMRSGNIRLLVSTDLVGRGIDVDEISHVINFDIPEDPETYVHRIGRTARIGKDGIAYTFVLPDQGKELTAIENFINNIIDCERLDGFEAFRKRSR